MLDDSGEGSGSRTFLWIPWRLPGSGGNTVIGYFNESYEERKIRELAAVKQQQSDPESR